MDLGQAVARRVATPARGAARTVEIVGPPGAGKSTLLAALAARRPDLRVIGRWRRAEFLPDFLLGSVAILPIGAARCLALRPLGRRDLERLVRLRAARRIAARWRRQGEVVVMDQGPVYTLATLRLGACAPAAGGRLAACWDRTARDWAGLIDRIIVLDADDAILIERICGREKPHALKSIAGADRRGWLAVLRGALERTVDRIAAGGRVEVVRFDTGQADLDGIAERIAMEIDRA
jgi:hypothetical protein